MSTLRSLERGVIKTKGYQKTGTTSTFKEDWNTYRTAKFGEATPKNTEKKKQRHYDGKNNLINSLIYQKNAIKAYLEGLKDAKETSEVNTESK